MGSNFNARRVGQPVINVTLFRLLNYFIHFIFSLAWLSTVDKEDQERSKQKLTAADDIKKYKLCAPGIGRVCSGKKLSMWIK
jgi:hypothetical protein